MTQRDYVPSAQLSALDKSRLKEELGVSEYLSYPQCEKSSSPYTPTASDGWRLGEHKESMKLKHILQ